jgi:hypothetical protein
MASTSTTDAIELAILTLMIDNHPAPVHREYLGRAFAGDDWPASVEAMLADGLVHREGELFLVSRAAVRVVEMLG